MLCYVTNYMYTLFRQCIHIQCVITIPPTQHRNTTGAHTTLVYKCRRSNQKRCIVLHEPIETTRVNHTHKSQKCFSVDSHFIIIHKTGLCFLCFSDHVKLAQNRWVLSGCQAISMRAMCVSCVCVSAGPCLFYWLLWVFVCLANYS